MNEYFNEQISEFIDDEMSVEESDFFVRRLQRDDEARARYLRYQLIGAAVRGECLKPLGKDLRGRTQAAPAGQEPAAASRSAWPQVVGGVGIAASVILLAFFGLRLTGPDSVTEVAEAAAFDADASAAIVPIANDGSRSFASAPGAGTGIQYLINHAQYTSGLNRTIVQSSVVAGRASDLVAVNEAGGIE